MKQSPGNAKQPQSRKRKKKKNPAKTAVLSLLIVGLLLAGGAFIYLQVMAGRLDKLEDNESYNTEEQQPEAMDPDYTGEVIDPPAINDNAQKLSDITLQTDTTYITNFLFLGVDTQNTTSYSGRSDSIMIVSVNSKKGSESIKLVSLLRDTYVPIKGYKAQKLNAAYHYGGHNLLLDTIEKQYRLKIDKVIAVNFEAYKLAIDKMGGVDIELTAAEAKEIKVGTKAKAYHLEGKDALEYARIRNIGNDWGRTGRQRKVIQALMATIKTMNVLELNGIMYDVFPEVKTNMSTNTIIGFIPKAISYAKYPVQETYFPGLDEFTDPYINGVGRAMVFKDQAKTVRSLHHFLYDGN